jgi:ribonucleoside-diphosphate reductase alpha chain
LGLPGRRAAARAAFDESLALGERHPRDDHRADRHSASARPRFTGMPGGTGNVALAVAVAADAEDETKARRLERTRAARIKGYEGDSCGECGNFPLVRNDTCLSCATRGASSGCS